MEESSAQGTDVRRIKIIAGVVIAILVAIIFTLVLGLISRNHSSSTCQLGTIQPVYDLSTLENIHSSDLKALANFAGYLEYNSRHEAAAKVFMPLILESVDLSVGDDGRQLTLQADCAKLIFALRDSVVTETVQSIRVDLVIANKKISTCRIWDTYMSYDATAHYNCTDKRVYNCVAVDEEESVVVAQLNIQAIEFELNGYPNAVKKGKFSTRATKC